MKRLNFGRKVRKRLKRRGFGVGQVVEKLYNPKHISQNAFLTSEGGFSLQRRVSSSIFVEKVDK